MLQVLGRRGTLLSVVGVMRLCMLTLHISCLHRTVWSHRHGCYDFVRQREILVPL